MYLTAKISRKTDRKDMLAAINLFEYHNKEMRKNLFVKHELKREEKQNKKAKSEGTIQNEKSALTNIRNESNTVVAALNEKIPRENVNSKKEDLKDKFKELEKMCNDYVNNLEDVRILKMIPEIIVGNIGKDCHDIREKLPFFSVGNNQSIKESAAKSRENECTDWEGPTTLRSIDNYLKQMSVEDSAKVSEEKIIHKKSFLGMKSFDEKIPEKKVSDMRGPVEKFLKGLVDKNSFCMRVREYKEVIESIKAEHFKNQFETNTSGGAFNPDLRRNVAGELFGVNFDTLSKLEGFNFEKYGYLDRPGIKFGPESYGRLKVIFRKAPLLNRVTLTVGDSLNRRNRQGVIASRVTNPKIESIPGVVRGDYSYLNNIYNLIDSKEINSDMEPQKVAKKISETGSNTEYFELQYHGKVTMDDVESWSLPKNKGEIINVYEKDVKSGFDTEDKIWENIKSVTPMLKDKQK